MDIRGGCGACGEKPAPAEPKAGHGAGAARAGIGSAGLRSEG